MTTFQIMSDIHQETSVVPLINVNDLKAKHVLLAGDITTGPRRLEYLKAAKDHEFWYVPGNHEYYRASWSWALGMYVEFFKGSNVHVMDRETVIVDNVRLIVATLWTNFQAPMKSMVEGSSDAIVWEDQQVSCHQGMADFTLIGGFSTYTALEEHNKALGYIKEVLSSPHSGPTIVMTHHAPSFKSSHPKYDLSYIKGGFCSELDYLIEEFQPEYWVHGHTHDSADYNIGRTKVLCNPRGYGIENLYGFNPHLTIEL
jgi:Icc-related predicted phosphoesterase